MIAQFANAPDKASCSPVRLGLWSGALLLCALAMPPSLAQDFPTRPIRIIVPYPAGGANDILARLVGQRIHPAGGQPVIVDNRAGGNSTIGTELTARAPADGHTMILTSLTHSLLPSLYPKLSFDAIRDFDAIAIIATSPAVLLAHPSLPVKSVKELIAWARARPGEINYGSSGAGGSGHLAMELLKNMTGLKLVHIPYKGMAPALNDLIGGQVVLMFGNLVPSLPHVQSGRLRAIAVTGSQRTPGMPDLPTVAESGLPGFEVITWLGLLGPAGIPAPIVDKLNREVNRIIKLPDIQERLVAIGFDPEVATPQQFMQRVKADAQKWARVVKEAGITAD